MIKRWRRFWYRYQMWSKHQDYAMNLYCDGYCWYCKESRFPRAWIN